MRGFKDRQEDLESFAGTATRSGQRVVDTVTAQHEGMILFSLDVSQAFANGMTFEEYARLTGTEFMEVEFDILPEDVPYIRRLPGFEVFDPKT